MEKDYINFKIIRAQSARRVESDGSKHLSWKNFNGNITPTPFLAADSEVLWYTEFEDTPNGVVFTLVLSVLILFSQYDLI